MVYDYNAIDRILHSPRKAGLHSWLADLKKRGLLGKLNPQTTVWGPLDPSQHSNSCKSETDNDLAKIFQVIYNWSKYCQIIAQLHSDGLLCDLGTQLAIGTFLR